METYARFEKSIALVALLSVPQLATSRALAIWVVIVAALVLLVLIRHFRAQGRPEHMCGWGSYPGADDPTARDYRSRRAIRRESCANPISIGARTSTGSATR